MRSGHTSNYYPTNERRHGKFGEIAEHLTLMHSVKATERILPPDTTGMSDT